MVDAEVFVKMARQFVDAGFLKPIGTIHVACGQIIPAHSNVCPFCQDFIPPGDRGATIYGLSM